MKVTEEAVSDLRTQFPGWDGKLPYHLPGFPERWTDQNLSMYIASGGRIKPRFNPDDLKSGGRDDGETIKKNDASTKRSNPPPMTSATVYKKWFPKSTWIPGDKPPQYRILAFHSAGGSETIFTSRGTLRFKDNRLVSHCKATGGDLLACQLPGRDFRFREERRTSIRTYVNEDIFPILEPILRQGEVPYVLMGHSMGCWFVYELLQRIAASSGVPLPRQIVVSCFLPPDAPLSDRPWPAKCGRTGTVYEIKAETKAWGANDVVLQHWNDFGQMIRDDTTLFDEYELDPDIPSAAPFPVPIHAYYAENDQRIKRLHVEGWERFTSKDFYLRSTRGAHLFFYDVPCRDEWMKTVIASLPDKFKNLTAK